MAAPSGRLPGPQNMGIVVVILGREGEFLRKKVGKNWGNERQFPEKKKTNKNSLKFSFSPVRFKWSKNRLERSLIPPFSVTSKFHNFLTFFLGFKLISINSNIKNRPA